MFRLESHKRDYFQREDTKDEKDTKEEKDAKNEKDLNDEKDEKNAKDDLADKALVADSLLCKFGRVHPDVLQSHREHPDQEQKYLPPYLQNQTSLSLTH